MKKIMLPIILLVFLIGCSSSSETASELYIAVNNNLTEQDELLLDNLKSNVQKFHQLNQELHMLLEEMKKEDELEAAIETMQIANEEAMYIFNLIELDEKPNDKSLLELRNHIQSSIEKYMEAMTIQLKGITTGDVKKTDEGYEQINKINKEFDQLLSSMNG